MRGKIQVERHKSSHTLNVKARFPPIIPDRDHPGGSHSSSSVQEMESVHDLGSGGKALVLEDAGTQFAKNAVKLRQAIATTDERTTQTMRGIQQARRRRSQFGGEAASKQAKRRETAKMNTLEASLQMWTMRDNECAQRNDVIRKRINQQRINMTSLKRVFNERCEDLRIAKEHVAEVMVDADAVEKLRQTAKEKLSKVIIDFETTDAHIRASIADANTYIDDANLRAMGRIDEVLQMIPPSPFKKMNQNDDDNDDTSTKKSGSGSSTFLTSGSNDINDSSSSSVRRSSGWKPPGNTNSTHEPYIEIHSDEEYKHAFNAIGKAMGGLSDPKDIVEQFLANENNLFEHFRDVERIHEKIKLESNDLRTINTKYDQITQQQMNANAATKLKLDQMQSRIDKTKEKDLNQKRTLTKIKLIFKKITTRMSEMFSTLGCDDMDDPNGLGRMAVGRSSGKDSKGSATMRQYLGATVSENNIIKYLGVIEAKTIEIYDRYLLRLEYDGVDIKQFGSHMNGPSRPHGNIRDLMHIEAPKMNITHLTHHRKEHVKQNEDKLEKGMMKQHEAVSPMSRDAIHKELMAVEAEKMGGGKKRRPGLGGMKKLKLAAAAAKEAERVIEYL